MESGSAGGGRPRTDQSRGPPMAIRLLLAEEINLVSDDDITPRHSTDLALCLSLSNHGLLSRCCSVSTCCCHTTFILCHSTAPAYACPRTGAARPWGRGMAPGFLPRRQDAGLSQQGPDGHRVGRPRPRRGDEAARAAGAHGAHRFPLLERRRLQAGHLRWAAGAAWRCRMPPPALLQVHLWSSPKRYAAAMPGCTPRPAVASSPAAPGHSSLMHSSLGAWHVPLSPLPRCPATPQPLPAAQARTARSESGTPPAGNASTP